VQKIYEKIEGKAAAEALPGESQTVIEVSGDETYSIEQTGLRRGPSATAEGIRLIIFPCHRLERSTIKRRQMFRAHGSGPPICSLLFEVGLGDKNREAFTRVVKDAFFLPLILI
jgi:hypothetical protein